jgi:hypothetical protein
MFLDGREGFRDIRKRTNLSGPAGRSLGYGGTRFLREDCGQPFYLRRGGWARTDGKRNEYASV